MAFILLSSVIGKPVFAAGSTTSTTDPAGVTASNSGPLTCNITSATITGSSTTSGATFSWAGTGAVASFRATGSTAVVTAPGTYILTATDPATGSTTTAMTTVIQTLTVPTGVTASTVGELTCSNNTVFLNGSSTTALAVTYAWTGPDGFSATGTSTTTSTAGVYTLTATYTPTGCTASANATVSRIFTAPGNLTATASGSLNCINASVALTASSDISGAGYTWAGPNGFTASGATVTATTAGTYTLTAANGSSAFGCTSTAAVAVVQDLTPPTALTIASATGTTIINCTNPTLSLTGNADPQNVTYSWSGPNSYSSANATASVTMPGTYTVTATQTSNGCSKTANVVIGLDTASPSAVTTSSVPANAVLTCSSPNIVLTGGSNSSGVTYLWTGPDGFSVANAVATATTPGTYTLTVTNPVNGCSTAPMTTAITQNVVAPVGVTANVANKITCTTTTTTLTGNSTTSGATFAWNGPGGFTSSAGSATASLGGVYTLTATNPTDGCTTSKTVTVVADTATPTGVTATNSGELNCTVTTVTLTGSSTTAGATYIWTGPDGYFDPEQISSMATDSGTYVLTVTDPENGCSTEALTYVAEDLSACSAIKAQVTAAKANTFDDSTLAAGFTYKVYPNPVSSTTASLEFRAPVAAQVIVEIYNNAGTPERVLFSNSVEANQSYRLTLNRSGLAAGVHYCMIRVNGLVYTSKLLLLP